MAKKNRFRIIISATLAVVTFSASCGVKGPPTPYIETEGGKPLASPVTASATPIPTPTLSPMPTPKPSKKKPVGTKLKSKTNSDAKPGNSQR